MPFTVSSLFIHSYAERLDALTVKSAAAAEHNSTDYLSGPYAGLYYRLHCSSCHASQTDLVHRSHLALCMLLEPQSLEEFKEARESVDEAVEAVNPHRNQSPSTLGTLRLSLNIGAGAAA